MSKIVFCTLSVLLRWETTKDQQFLCAEGTCFILELHFDLGARDARTVRTTRQDRTHVKWMLY